MLNTLFEQVDRKYGDDIFFMGLAFKTDRGIVIIDKFFNEEDIEDGYIVRFVSFGETAKPVSAILKDLNELDTFMKEIAL